MSDDELDARYEGLLEPYRVTYKDRNGKMFVGEIRAVSALDAMTRIEAQGGEWLEVPERIIVVGGKRMN